MGKITIPSFSNGGHQQGRAPAVPGKSWQQMCVPPRGSWRQFSGWGVSQETPGKRASLLGGSEVGGCCGGHGGRQEEGALLSETWKKALHALVWTPSLHSGSTSSLLRKGCLLTLCLQSGTVLCFIPLVPSKSLRFRIWVSLRVSFSFFFFFF